MDGYREHRLLTYAHAALNPPPNLPPLGGGAGLPPPSGGRAGEGGSTRRTVFTSGPRRMAHLARCNRPGSAGGTPAPRLRGHGAGPFPDPLPPGAGTWLLPPAGGGWEGGSTRRTVFTSGPRRMAHLARCNRPGSAGGTPAPRLRGHGAGPFPDPLPPGAGTRLLPPAGGGLGRGAAHGERCSPQAPGAWRASPAATGPGARPGPRR